MQTITHQFEHHLKLSQENSKENDKLESLVEDQENEEEEVEDFSFEFDAENFSTISAEDAFDNGRIKPVFQLFNRDFLLGCGDDVEDSESLSLKGRLPNVKNVFVEADDGLNATTTSTAGDEDVVGPNCEWSKKVVEVSTAAPVECKKSNSTGFSKIWRFKDFLNRSNSDGRDAFVFLNHASPSTMNSPAAASVRMDEKSAEDVSLKTVNGNNGGVGGEVEKVKKVKKSKTATLSPHEVYMRSKAKDSGRRRSYLPYRPELVGLFTNLNGGGLTRNVHPF